MSSKLTLLFLLVMFCLPSSADVLGTIAEGVSPNVNRSRAEGRESRLQAEKEILRLQMMRQRAYEEQRRRQQESSQDSQYGSIGEQKAVFDKIRQLGQLKDEGAISPKQYKDKVAELLERL